MILNLDSPDEKLRELSCISLANLSSEMDASFYEKFLSVEILQKLVDRIQDAFSQISYNSISAIQRLTSLCKIHNKSEHLEKTLGEVHLIESLKQQIEEVVNRVKTVLSSKVDNKEALSNVELSRLRSTCCKKGSVCNKGHPIDRHFPRKSRNRFLHEYTYGWDFQRAQCTLHDMWRTTQNCPSNKVISRFHHCEIYRTVLDHDLHTSRRTSIFE